VTAPARPVQPWLSPRDLEIVRLAVNGATDVEISKATGISLYGIHERWRSFIRPNLGAANRTHAVAIALTAGLVPGEAVRPLDPPQPRQTA
jgi:DNA-binding NarL/FixJ family response regulator